MGMDVNCGRFPVWEGLKAVSEELELIESFRLGLTKLRIFSKKNVTKRISPNINLKMAGIKIYFLAF
jgi:hypothetical protein